MAEDFSRKAGRKPAQIKKIVDETAHLDNFTKEEELLRGKPVAFDLAKQASGLTLHAEGHLDACTCAECMAASDHKCRCYGCEGPWRPQKPKALMDGGSYFTAELLAREGLTGVIYLERDDGGYAPVFDAADVDVDKGVAHRVSLPMHQCRNPRFHKGTGDKRGACLYEDRGAWAVHVQELPREVDA